MSGLFRHHSLPAATLALMALLPLRAADLPDLFAERVRSCVTVEFLIETELDRQPVTVLGTCVDAHGTIILPATSNTWRIVGTNNAFVVGGMWWTNMGMANSGGRIVPSGRRCPIHPRSVEPPAVGHVIGFREIAPVVEQADLIARSAAGYAAVLDAYMEEPPFIANWHLLAATPQVIVVPFFISDGLHSYQDIPVLLGIENETGTAASQREIFRHNLRTISHTGLPGPGDMIIASGSSLDISLTVI